MKKIGVIFCIMFMSTFSASIANALDLYALASYWEVEDADGTWGLGGGVSVPLFTEIVRLDARAFSFENSDLDEDDELELIPIDLGLQLHVLPGAVFDPYLLGGASWIYADANRVDVDSDVGGYVGAGLEFGLTETFRLFGEAVYRFAKLDSDSRLDGEIEINGLTANAGVKVHF